MEPVYLGPLSKEEAEKLLGGSLVFTVPRYLKNLPESESGSDTPPTSSEAVQRDTSTGSSEPSDQQKSG